LTDIIGKKPDFTRPVLFLDFDDVINIFSDTIRKDPTGFCQKTVIFKKGTNKPDGGLLSSDREMHLVWNGAVVDVLRGLNAIWISSWKHLSQSVLNPLLEFDFGYADWKYRGFSNPSHDGKRLAIEQIVNDNNIPAFAIADDSFFQNEDKMIVGVDGLIKVPEYGGAGLSQDDARAIRQFLEAEHSVPFKKFDFAKLKEGGYCGRVFYVAYIDGNDTDCNRDHPLFCFNTIDEARKYQLCKQASDIYDIRDFSELYQIVIAYADIKDGFCISSGIAEPL
jgi:hypothetical protein